MAEPAQEGVQVYVAARPFTAFGGKLLQSLPDNKKALLVDAGICHYMTIFCEPSGRIVMCDFGPVGGDVHVDLGPLATAERPSAAASGKRGRKRKAVQGEVRVAELDALPATCMHVGACEKSFDELLAFNSTRDTMYELNVNDCRHYVNDLVREATGEHNVAVRLVRHQFRSRRSHSLRPVDHIFPALQCMTDAQNWTAIQRGANAAAAMLLLRMGHPYVLAPLASVSTGATAASALAARAASAMVHHKRAVLSTTAAAVAAAGNRLTGLEAQQRRGPVPRLGALGQRVTRGVSTAVASTAAGATCALQHTMAQSGRPVRLLSRYCVAGGGAAAAVPPRQSAAVPCAAAPQCAAAWGAAAAAMPSARHHASVAWVGEAKAFIHRPVAAAMHNVAPRVQAALHAGTTRLRMRLGARQE